jgi:D-alanyl-lipoteichoic acid acyltransferase DltB (MBOAT superfamily)
MAIGAGRMFGIKLPLNFNSPYKAVSIIDFWRRWHITLSNFLRDYLYIPLGGNRKGKLRRHINLMITMLLGGLWHGAGWTFVFWGGLHGTYLIINHQWNSLRRTLGHDLKKSHWWSRCLGILVTFIAVVVGWVFFRAENMETAIAMCYAMVGANGFSLASSLPIDKKVVLLMLLCVWLLPNTQQWIGQHNPALDYQTGAEKTSGWGKRLWQKLQWHPTFFNSFLVSVIAFIAIIKVLSATKTEFLYFNF